MWFYLLACQSEVTPKKQVVIEEKVETEEDDEAEETEELEENKPPLFTSLAWTNPKAKTGDELRVIAKGKDPEGERPRFQYQWFVNGKKLVAQQKRYLKPSFYQKKDEVVAQVTVTDGVNEVNKKLAITIANSTPQWESDPRAVKQIDGYRVKAVDADKDELVYKLRGAPKGMTIDPKLGVLSYKGSKDEPGGAYKITVLAEDPEGESARWSFQINVSAGSASKKVKKEQSKK